MNIKDILLRVETKYKAKGQVHSDFVGVGTSTMTTEMSFETNEFGDILNYYDGGSGRMKIEYYDIIELFDLTRNELVFDTKRTQFTKLHNAVYYGNLEKVKKNLKEGIDINTRMPHGDTALFMAINCKQDSIADFLIDAKADVELSNFNKQTPLLACAATGNVEILRKLIAKKANINHQDIIGQTALHLAVWENHFEVLQILLENKTNFITSFFKQKINPNIQSDQGATALHFAVAHHRIEMIPVLIKHGTNLMLKDKRGFTALDQAKSIGNSTIISLLES